MRRQGSSGFAGSVAQREPGVRIILSPKGIERMEVWGRTDSELRPDGPESLTKAQKVKIFTNCVANPDLRDLTSRHE